MLKPKPKHAINREQIAPALEAYRARTLAFCDQRLSALFEAAGPALLGFAEVAGSDAAQSLFFATAAQLDDEQAAIKQRFQAGIQQGLTHFFTQGRKHPSPWLPRPDLVGSDERELQTLANRDETQALKNLIIRTNAHCFPDLYALSQRLAAIAGGGKLRDDEIPAGPHHLAHSFRAAMAENAFDIRVKVVLYALFHHRVTWFAAVLYRELNDILREAGVLPKTRPVNLRRSRQQSLQSGANQRHLLNPNDHEALHQALVNDLLELAASHSHPASIESNTGSDASVTKPKLEHKTGEPTPLDSFLRAVSRPSETSSSVPPLLPQPPGGRDERIAIASLNKASLHARDPELINTIEQLFSHMYDTPGLPSVAKATLGRLQVAYIKAAMNDISLVRDPGHPARTLLDECVEAGSRWIDESDPRQGALPILHEIVERILNTPEGTPPPFDALFEHLHQHTRNLHHLHHPPERRCRDLHREREFARKAQRQARGEILELLRHYEVPRQVRVFLDTLWVELLTLVSQHRDEGPDSPSWRETLDTARTLVEVFDPRITGAALRARIAELPRLRQRIHNGAQRLGSYNRATLGALDNLLANAQSIREQLRRTQMLPSRPPVSLPSLPRTDLDNNPSADEDGPLQETAPDVSDGALQAMIDELRKTKSGTWFELDSPFRGTEADGRRIQLSWISPLTSTYLFVDEAGTKTEMRGLKDLAKAMLSGRARVVAPPEGATPQQPTSTDPPPDPAPPPPPS
ncbi:DUF1631 family protein [Rhabdochromatium marinum]|uniref:DUF1631 family protein n=1 Tax=Rhabdochromatium marinum TaxID=48729 RepID=UPI001904022F